MPMNHPSGASGSPNATSSSSKERPTMNTFLRKDDGQDMVEYALLASFISIVAIVALRAIGPLVRTIYDNVQASLT
jgi:Flp pilus assembly pilin Flp